MKPIILILMFLLFSSLSLAIFPFEDRTIITNNYIVAGNYAKLGENAYFNNLSVNYLTYYNYSSINLTGVLCDITGCYSLAELNTTYKIHNELEGLQGGAESPTGGSCELAGQNDCVAICYDNQACCNLYAPVGCYWLAFQSLCVDYVNNCGVYDNDKTNCELRAPSCEFTPTVDYYHISLEAYNYVENFTDSVFNITNNGTYAYNSSLSDYYTKTQIDNASILRTDNFSNILNFVNATGYIINWSNIINPNSSGLILNWSSIIIDDDGLYLKNNTDVNLKNITGNYLQINGVNAKSLFMYLKGGTGSNNDFGTAGKGANAFILGGTGGYSGYSQGGKGGFINITSGTGGNSEYGNAGDGGNLYLYSGQGGGSPAYGVAHKGGNVYLYSGDGGSSTGTAGEDGGIIYIISGTGGTGVYGSGGGGDIHINSGHGKNSLSPKSGGDLYIKSGNAGNCTESCSGAQDGGNYYMAAGSGGWGNGTGVNSGDGGAFYIYGGKKGIGVEGANNGSDGNLFLAVDSSGKAVGAVSIGNASVPPSNVDLYIQGNASAADWLTHTPKPQLTKREATEKLSNIQRIEKDNKLEWDYNSFGDIGSIGIVKDKVNCRMEKTQIPLDNGKSYTIERQICDIIESEIPQISIGKLTTEMLLSNQDLTERIEELESKLNKICKNNPELCK